MLSTSASLLDCLRRCDDRSVWIQAWNRFADLYTPLIYSWARRAILRSPGDLPQDADDLVQQVFLRLIEELPHFHYDAASSFRGWLKTVTHNEWGTMVPQTAFANGGQGISPRDTGARHECL